MVTAEKLEARARLTEIDGRLEPRRSKTIAVEDLDDLFRSGRSPDPLPNTFLNGRLITLSVSGPVDSFVRRLTHVWMPWLGKSFDRAAETGVNVLRKEARVPMRALWPSYEPERVFAERIEAFTFRTRVAPGAVDPEVDVLKIDYDFEANPSFIIRKILDELVQIDDGLYLGKILYRLRSSYRPIGFFLLEGPAR